MFARFARGRFNQFTTTMKTSSVFLPFLAFLGPLPGFVAAHRHVRGLGKANAEKNKHRTVMGKMGKNSKGAPAQGKCTETKLITPQLSATEPLQFFDGVTNDTTTPLGNLMLTISSVNEVDCTFQGALLFDYDYDNITELYATSINILGSCTGKAASIAGGTGDYACASGYLDPIDQLDDNSLVWNLVVCGTCGH